MAATKKTTYFMVLAEERIVSVVMDHGGHSYQKLFYSPDQTAKEKQEQLLLARINLFGAQFTCLEKKERSEAEVMVIGELVNEKQADKFVSMAKDALQRNLIDAYREFTPDEIEFFKDEYFYLFPEFFLLQGV